MKQVIILLLAMISLTQCFLKPPTLELQQLSVFDSSQSPDSAIDALQVDQDEVYQKVYRDFLNSVVKKFRELNTYATSDEINKLLYEKATSSDLERQVKDFMIQVLFAKFEMNNLSESFGQEIKSSPDNYFLTFEMYDLLHD